MYNATIKLFSISALKRGRCVVQLFHMVECLQTTIYTINNTNIESRYLKLQVGIPESAPKDCDGVTVINLDYIFVLQLLKPLSLQYMQKKTCSYFTFLSFLCT